MATEKPLFGQWPFHGVKLTLVKKAFSATWLDHMVKHNVSYLHKMPAGTCLLPASLLWRGL